METLHKSVKKFGRNIFRIYFANLLIKVMIIVLTQIIDAYQVTNDANGERLVRKKEMAYY